MTKQSVPYISLKVRVTKGDSLRESGGMLRVGGVIIFSTCSFLFLLFIIFMTVCLFVSRITQLLLAENVMAIGLKMDLAPT